MAASNYSGSQDITGCIITSWTSTSYYSFKLTQDCKLSISGTPAITARAGDEFIIQDGEPYIFDRDTKVLLSYPITETVVPSSVQLDESNILVSFNYSAGTYFGYVGVVAERAFSNYDIFTAQRVYLSTTASGVIFRLVYNGTVLASVSKNFTGLEHQYVSIAASGVTTAIPKDGIIELQVEGAGTTCYLTGDKFTTIVRLTENE